jgi:hypothetical protein
MDPSNLCLAGLMGIVSVAGIFIAMFSQIRMFIQRPVKSSVE